MNKVIVFAVHPDDETLGCGGTLLKHKLAGDEVHWVIATEMKKSDGFKKTLIKKRDAEINKVAKLYNFDAIHRLGLSTKKVDEYVISNLIEKISSVINDVEPNIIYLPFKGDVHSDHRRIFEAAYSCTKSFRYSFIRKIYMFETISETEFSPSTKEDSFVPNTFIDISEFMEKKVSIMGVYDGELGQHPFPRSDRNIRAIATFRGATSGCDYAESFVLLKEINKE